MSLFKAREWWRTKCGDGEEEFDTACIAVGDVLNTNTGDAQIVTGSLNGVLRIHQPHSSSSNSGTTSGGGSVGVGAEGVGAQSKSATSAAGIGSGQYSIEDLLYERNFGEPILGVRTGQFTSQGHVVLALLFSRRLSVYRVSRNGGGIDASGHMGMLNTNNAASTTAIDASSSGHTAHAAASFYTLSVCYEHQLDRNAYSMCTGQFGGAYTFTYIAVQSLDGAISVFENESLAYTRFIPGFLLPGPLAYCLSTDAIVTANSNFEVQSFKCATLTAANAAGGAANNAANAARRSLPEHEHGHVHERDAAAAASMSGTAGPLTHHQPRVKEDWKVVIGELALDIQVGKVLGASTASSSAAEDVVVLGEQTLFVLSADAGRIKMQRRLDYLPVCMHLYRVEDPLHHNRSMHADRAVSSMSSESANGAFCNILVGSSTGVILIYRELDLIWSAKCDFVNVSLSVARIGGVSGLIVGLGDAGQLDVNFIGTDPPTNGAMNAAAAVGIDADGRGSADDEMEYEQMDNEHRQLLAKIRERCSSNNANGIGGAAASTDTLEKVVIRAQVPSCLDSAASRKRTAGVSEYHHNDALDGFDAAASVYSGRSVTIRLYVSGTGTGRRSIEDLSLLLSVAEPFFIVGEKRVHVGRVPNSSANDAASSSAAPAASLSFTVGIDETPGRDMLLPGDTEVTVTAQYAVVGSSSSSAGGSTTGVETIKVQLPLCLSVDAIPPVKADGFKITLETNRQPPLLAVLFDDIIPTSSSTASGAAVAPGGRGVGELSAAAMEAAATSEMAAMHEMHAMNASIFGNAITLRYLNGIEVTVLVSKNAGRYRVQSACFEAMWLAVNELQRRLSMFFIDSSASSSSTSSGPFCISFGEPLPLQDYFALIDSHHSIRHGHARSKRQLARLAHQFRVIQKRVLARYKNPTSSSSSSASSTKTIAYGNTMENLTMLLEQTFDAINDTVRSIADCECRLRTVGNRLSCGTRLMLALMKLRFALDDESARVLSSYLLPEVIECGDATASSTGTMSEGTVTVDGQESSSASSASIGWEELVDASLLYLLRTSLSMKSSSHHNNNAAGGRADGSADSGDSGATTRHSVIAPMHEDVDKLKRHISIVCERLSKGGVRLR